MPAFPQGHKLDKTDLPIFFDQNGCASDPYSISFDFVDCTDSNNPLIIGMPNRVPVKIGVGKYYPAITVDGDEPLGVHKIVWHYKESSSDEDKIIEREFDVISSAAITGAQYPERVKELIYELRKKLRDINPDRDYHFSAPSSETTISGFSKCRGYRWPDEQLANHITQAANYINLYAPISCFDVCSWPCLLENLLLKQAMVYALYDMVSLWIHEEFDYSLNGISLSISRSDKYLSLAQSVQQQVDNQLEKSKSALFRVVKGLRQSPYTYSRGAAGALGPYTSGQSVRRWIRG